MALSRGRSSNRFAATIWPGFVDAMTALLMVLMFVLVVKAYWLVVLLVRWRKRRAGAAVLKQVLENGV